MTQADIVIRHLRNVNLVNLSLDRTSWNRKCTILVGPWNKDRTKPHAQLLGLFNQAWCGIALDFASVYTILDLHNSKSDTAPAQIIIFPFSLIHCSNIIGAYHYSFSSLSLHFSHTEITFFNVTFTTHALKLTSEFHTGIGFIHVVKGSCTEQHNVWGWEREVLSHHGQALTLTPPLFMILCKTPSQAVHLPPWTCENTAQSTIHR